jgi:hypothetical protein
MTSTRKKDGWPTPRFYEVRVEIPLRFVTYDRRVARRTAKAFFELWAQAMTAVLGLSAGEMGRPKILSISQSEALEIETSE